MTITCLEGPSAVGKTTVAKALNQMHGFERIPEVNEIFVRPQNESEFWYLERQVDRWKLATERSMANNNVLLDGDPFQPVWYNPVYPEKELQPIHLVLEFYINAVAAGEISAPNKYYLLTSSEEKLMERKRNDKSRTRSGFDDNLRFIQPQLCYFRSFDEISPGIVSFQASDYTQRLVDEIVAGVGFQDDMHLVDKNGLINFFKSRMRDEHNKTLERTC